MDHLTNLFLVLFYFLGKSTLCMWSRWGHLVGGAPDVNCCQTCSLLYPTTVDLIYALRLLGAHIDFSESWSPKTLL